MFYPFIISLFAGLSTLLGALVIFIKLKNNINNFIIITLSISFTIMIGISIFDLIPVSFINILKNNNIYLSSIIVIIFFIIGYILVVVISKLLNNTSKKDLYKLGILNMMALIIHNFPEGIITFMTSYADIEFGFKISLGIVFHNIAEGMAIAVPIYYATSSKKKALGYSLFAGLSEPLGAIITYIFLKDYITYFVLDRIMIITGGIMITLAINEIYPKIKINKKLFLKGLLIGIIWIIISNLIF